MSFAQRFRASTHMDCTEIKGADSQVGVKINTFTTSAYTVNKYGNIL